MGLLKKKPCAHASLGLVFSALCLNAFGAEHVAGAPSVITSNPGVFNYVATALFACAVLHTFLASKFMAIAHHIEQGHREKLLKRAPAMDQAIAADATNEVSFKAQMFHFLGEIEVVFGLWVIPLFAAMIWLFGWHESVVYLDSRHFTEPLFVLVIMTIAASRPVLVFAQTLMSSFAGLGGNSVAAWWFSILTVGPLLGSLITEPAAITISALLLARKFYDRIPSPRLAYATLGLLLVNVSIGGTLTHFAAPPVLMVAGKWGWDTLFMFTHFGWKAGVAVILSNALFWAFFRKEFALLNLHQPGEGPTARMRAPVPKPLILIHLFFLGWTVLTNQSPVLFVGGFLFFLGLTQATAHHQDDLSLRGPLLVAFFLGGLVIHGGLQSWWIAPLLGKLGETPLFLGATILTAFNDNAAITYLASLVPDLQPNLKYVVVAGAVVGGGLTVIANAPNPAGIAILRRFFNDSVSPLGLAAGALVPTIIAGTCFLFL